jgi:thioredoxin-like negative regulator of GroEL
MIHRATDDTLDLEIRILQRQEQGYRVELTLAGQQEFPPGYLTADILPWSSSGDLDADGRNLFEALFQDVTLREAWGWARGQSPQRRIRLRIDPPELNVVPWELLNDGTAMLSAQADTPFSRYLPIALPWGGEITERPIRVLVAISNPDDLETKYNLPRADVALERAALKEAFNDVPGVQVDFLDEPVTLERVEEKLCQGYHVLHFLGHGAFSVKRRQAALYLQDAQGHAARVLDDDMASMLTRQGVRPRLVFLAACQSAMRSSADAFLGLGPKLVQAGVPAVVAMQDFVSVETARKFSGAFYQRLMEHGQVDLATNEARSTLLTAGRPDAAVPVLFVRIESGLLWSERVPRVVHGYLAAVRDYCASLPYRSLHDIRPPKTLDEVYVPLKARPQPRKEKQDPRGLRPTEGWHDLEGLERHGPLSIADVMRTRNQPHVLILGEPGAGKSTLLRQMAERAWDAPDKIGLDVPCLPLLVPLRRLAESEGSLEERLRHALTGELALTQDLPESFFSRWRDQTGTNWLLLLDALDEVPADQRPRLMDWLKRILKTVWPNRIVITSRPSGYSSGGLDDKLFGHYDLLPFTPEQTSEFALRWFDYDQTQADRFLQELDRVRAGDLHGTPLLLTIAAKVYLEKGTLPKRRSALYDQFVDIWLAEAEQRGLRAELGDPVCDVAKFALARLALAMTEQPMQSEVSLSQVAAAYLRDAVPLSTDRAEVAGERFVSVMARRSGVFTRRGDAYDFIHPTFREYLAAWVAVRECKQDPELVWQRVISHWADEKWREVALFAVGILSDKGIDVTSLARRIWRSGPTGLAFVGDAFAEGPIIDAWLSDGVVDSLLGIARDDRWIEVPAITILSRLKNHPSAVAGLRELATNSQTNVEVRVEAAQILSGWGYEVEAATVLKAIAQNTEVWAWIRERAVMALCQLGYTDEAAVVLLALARDKKVKADLRIRAAEVLGELGQANEVAPILLVLACDKGIDAEMRVKAARALGHLGKATEATPVLLALAHDEEMDVDARIEAAEILSELGQTEEAVPILLVLARDEKVDPQARCRAAEELGHLGQAEEAVPILLAQARDKTVNADVRWRAAEVLSELGRADVLLALASDEKVDTWMRECTIMVLGWSANARVLLDLERIAQADKDEDVRWAAQEAIEHIHLQGE